MNKDELIFNPPPGWPKPPAGWKPPKGWAPDPKWPAPPDGWQLWIRAASEKDSVAASDRPDAAVQPPPAGTASAGSQEVNELQRRIVVLEGEVAALRSWLSDGARGAQGNLSDDLMLQEAGIYRYHHPLESAVAYQTRLAELSERIAAAIKAGNAIRMSSNFTFDNSLAKGQRLARDLGMLMLRAYNAEVDNCLRSLRLGNVKTAKWRIESTKDAVAKLGATMEMRVSEEFHAMRIEELELTSDYLVKKDQERQAAREERARLREERRAEAELAAERERLEKERLHLVNALAAVRSGGGDDPDLERKLAEMDEAIAQNDFRAANIRSGYVYVVSNRGSFGAYVVKIGMTRRLEPQERIDELGGASVPFRFDLHGLFFSEDAVTLETELHKHFASRRINMANGRKEFFFATPSEVREALATRIGNLIDYTESATSTEFLQSLRYWPEERRRERAGSAGLEA